MNFPFSSRVSSNLGMLYHHCPSILLCHLASQWTPPFRVCPLEAKFQSDLKISYCCRGCPVPYSAGSASVLLLFWLPLLLSSETASRQMRYMHFSSCLLPANRVISPKKNKLTSASEAYEIYATVQQSEESGCTQDQLLRRLLEYQIGLFHQKMHAIRLENGLRYSITEFWEKVGSANAKNESWIS